MIKLAPYFKPTFFQILEHNEDVCGGALFDSELSKPCVLCSVPKEYLTLHTGERENYSEIYGKRLMEPNSCPNNGTRDENCECVADAQR